jgi:hypothetical protein
MAGIRGAKNPFPTKPPVSKGPFKAGPKTFEGATGTLGYARGGDRKGPPSGRNSGTSKGKSHYVNQGLKRGTAG